MSVMKTQRANVDVGRGAPGCTLRRVALKRANGRGLRRIGGYLGYLCMAILGCLFSITAANAQARQPQLFLTFDYHMRPAQAAAAPARYVFVWGDSASMTSALAKYSPGSLLSAYFPYARDPDAKHDLAFWQARHPTWVTYRCDGVTPAYFPGDTNVPLDISNPAVLAWQVDQFTHLRPGLHAVALDNFQFQNKIGVCGVHDSSGRFVRKYSGKLDDPAFAAAAVDWLESISAALHERHVKVVVNHIPDLSPAGDDPASPLVARMVSAVDGILDEHAQDALHDANKAALLAKLVQYVQSRGKWMYLLYQLDDRGSDELESAVANYLITAGPKTAIYVSHRDHDYGNAPDFSGFDKPVGLPCGPAINKGGALFRAFSHGLAIFAPADRVPEQFTVPAGYQTVDGRSVGTQVRLTGGQGRVFYAPSGNACVHH